MTTTPSPPLPLFTDKPLTESKRAQSSRLPSFPSKGHRPAPDFSGFGFEFGERSSPGSPTHTGKFMPFSPVLVTPQRYKGTQKDFPCSPGNSLLCPQTPGRMTPVRKNIQPGEFSLTSTPVRRSAKIFFGEKDSSQVCFMKLIGEGNFSYVYEALDKTLHTLYALKVSKYRTRSGTPEKKEESEQLRNKLSIRLDMPDDGDDEDDDDDDDADAKFEALFGDDKDTIDESSLFDTDLIMSTDDLFHSRREKRNPKSPASSFVRTKSTDTIDDEDTFSYARSARPLHTPPPQKMPKTELPLSLSLEDESFSSDDIDDRSTVDNTRVLSAEELAKEPEADIGPIVPDSEHVTTFKSFIDDGPSLSMTESHNPLRLSFSDPFPLPGYEEPRSDKLPDPIVMVQEAEIQKKFQGVKEIVQVEGCWRNADSRICILMELCGPSLKSVLDRIDKPLPMDLYLSFFKDMARALVALEKESVLHMDIKPDNIFMVPESDWMEADLRNVDSIKAKFKHVKLGDFGVALDKEALKKVYLPDGDGKYAAKEAMSGHPTHACDMFSLGITMYELAIPSLVLPLNGQLWEALRSDDVDSSQWTYSPELFEVIKRMLSSEPGNRPRPAELCEILDKL